MDLIAVRMNLRKLNKRYASDKFECIVIYGRRRVGKTALKVDYELCAA